MKVTRGQDAIPIPRLHTVERAAVQFESWQVPLTQTDRKSMAGMVTEACARNNGLPPYGVPAYFSLLADEILLHPLPDKAYEIRILLTPPRIEI